MQTSLNIQSVVAEARELVGWKFIESSFYRKERQASMIFKGPKKKLALSLMFHPLAHGALLVPPGKLSVNTNEKPFPFFQELYGGVVSSLEQINNDRIIKLTLSAPAGQTAIIIEALGPSGNLWTLDHNNGRSGVLRNRDYVSGEQYSLPGELRGPSALRIKEKELEELLRNETESLAQVLRKIGGLDGTLVEEVCFRADIDSGKSAAATSPGERERLFSIVCQLSNTAKAPQNGYFYSEVGAAQVFKLKSVEAQPEKFPTYSLAFLALSQYRRTQHQGEDSGKRLQKSLKSAIAKKERLAGKLESDINAAENFERQRETADLIKANLQIIPRGAESITLDDLYGSGSREIKLNPRLSAADNADRYYKRYQKGRDGLELLQRRLEHASAELAQMKIIAEELERSPDEAAERYQAELMALAPRHGARTTPDQRPVRLPYREYTLSTGARVFVGREGSDNDETTFKHIKPHELWFHASQCPGSHVGLKFPNKDFTPSKREIEETAAIAAWFSKARNNLSAPVNYTLRRYVRKPRKAKAGLVTIEREKTVMVTPCKPEVIGDSAKDSPKR